MSSTHVAVAAPDPGGDGGLGEPRPMAVDAAAARAEGGAGGSLGGGNSSALAAGEADVTMTEAVEEEEVAVAGEAKGAVVEGGDAASDPLYATESAGMVVDERPVDAAGGVVGGGDCGEEKPRPEVRVLPDEAAGKPVPVEDVAIASATPEPAGAESGKLEENHVDKGKDNGVARGDGEMQSNVIADVEGSAEIEEDDGSPTIEEHDDEPEMLPPSGATNSDLCARYSLPPLDKGDFRVSDLVWGKVKSHPWWPGEIFDPADASELALKHQKKGSHLIAYFGDNTFAWCDESQLKPFVANYSQMEKQSSSDAFVSSVNYALEELSRRILSGMSCSCLPEELSDNGMSYMVENAGLKEGVTCSAVNQSEILSCFSSENLLNYVKSLALFPGQGGDLLELVIACSQLTSFYRSKGCPELASFQTGSAWVEDGMDTSSIKDVVVDERVTNEEPPAPDKPKRGRGRPRKQKPEDGLELMEKKATSNLSTDNACHHPAERQMDMEFDDFDGLQSKKRSIDSFEDPETKTTTPTFGSSFKIGECIRRAASQLTGSSSIVKSQNELMPHKNVAETENGDFDVSSDDAINELSVEKRAKRRRINRHHNADPKELLSQMCSVAADPRNGYSFSAMIINYFSDYRNYVVSTTTEANIVEKPTSKRGRKRKVLPSPEVETTDHMQDSYWSGLSLHNHPIHDLRRASTSTRPRRRRRSSRDTYFHAQQNLQHGLLSPKKQIQVIERSIIHVDEKIVDEVKPTALVLSFGRSTALPSETDLVKMFGRYGPLKESETEVHTSLNTVKVVFKKRADAERAFSFAGKFSTFGPSLRSYRLVNMPFFLVSSQSNNPEAHPECNGLEIPGPSESKVSLDAAQTDQVDKTDEKIEDKPTAEVLAMETGDAMDTSGSLEEKTENKAAAEALKIEDKPTAEVLAMETVDAMDTSGSLEEKTENKATAEALADNTTEGEVTAEIHVEETTTTEKILEDKELAEKTTEDETKAEVNVEEITTEKTVEDKTVPEETTEGEATAEVLEESTTTEKTVEDNTAAEETTEVGTKAEVHVEGATPSDKVVEEKALAEETTKGETKPEVPVEETTTEETVGDKALDETTKGETTAEVSITTEKTVTPDEKTETSNDVVRNASVEEPDKKTTANDAAEDATVEEPDQKTTANDPAEDATVEEPDKKTTTNDPVEDATVEEPDKTTMAAGTIEESVTVEAPDEKTMTTEKTVHDPMVEGGTETAVAEETVEPATIEASAGQSGATEQTG